MLCFAIKFDEQVETFGFPVGKGDFLCFILICHWFKPSKWAFPVERQELYPALCMTLTSDLAFLPFFPVGFIIKCCILLPYKILTTETAWHFWREKKVVTEVLW